MENLNSSCWKEDFTNLSKALYNKFKIHGYDFFIKYNNNSIDKAFEYYENLYPSICSNMKDKDKNLDRHKIIAGYVEAFLYNPVFFIDEKQYNLFNQNTLKIISRLPNEIFLYYLIIRVLESFNKKLKNNDKYVLKIPKNIYNWHEETKSDYKEHLIKLIHYYYNNLDNYSLFSFAHILFFIEACNDCANCDLKKFYYN